MEFNLAQVFAAVAAANPDRDCIVFGDRRYTYAQTAERARRFSRALHGWGLGARRERVELAPYESGQSHLGLYMANCNEFLEAMLGAYGARVAPFNVNYRYVADELVYLLGNARAEAVMYHARFAPTLAESLRTLGADVRLIHVDDGSGHEPLPGAVRYEDLLASVSDEPLDLALSPDDLYVLYTGGTTGMPKAVLWRQNDIYPNAMGGRNFGTGEMVTSLEEIVERSAARGPGFDDGGTADARGRAVGGFYQPVRRAPVRDGADDHPLRSRRGAGPGQPRAGGFALDGRRRLRAARARGDRDAAAHDRRLADPRSPAVPR